MSGGYYADWGETSSRDAYRVLVTGSRDWPSAFTVYEVLSGEARKAHDAGAHQLIVVHGACPRGADEMASEWCAMPNEFADMPAIEERHPADWDGYGKRAGFMRNLEMVMTGADVCVAFHKDNSPGTKHCMENARRWGIPVRRFTA